MASSDVEEVVQDGNEEICGACLLPGTLICCEHCPAAYHLGCAGYGDYDEPNLPEAWYCWACCVAHRRTYAHPTLPAQVSSDAKWVYVALDTTGELFYKATITARSQGKLLVQRYNASHSEDVEIIDLCDRRLWHGETGEAAWEDLGDSTFTPKCRYYVVDSALMQERLSQQTSQTPIADEESFMDAVARFYTARDKKDVVSGEMTVLKQPLKTFNVWTEVQAWGGFHEVCQRNAWGMVSEELGIDSSTAPLRGPYSTTAAIKTAYSTTLLDFELAARQGLAGIVCPPCTKSPRTYRRRKGRGPSKRSGSTAGLESPSGAPEKKLRRVVSSTHADRAAASAAHAAIGIVEPTDAALSLQAGECIEARVMRGRSVGGWAAAKVLQVLPASIWEGKRLVKLQYDDDAAHKAGLDNAVVWLPLLYRNTLLELFLTPIVMLRRPSPVPDSAAAAAAGPPSQPPWLVVGAAVEGLLEGCWVEAVVLRQASAAMYELRSIDVTDTSAPTITWICKAADIRRAHALRASQYGMVHASADESRMTTLQLQKAIAARTWPTGSSAHRGARFIAFTCRNHTLEALQRHEERLLLGTAGNGSTPQQDMQQQKVDASNACDGANGNDDDAEDIGDASLQPHTGTHDDTTPLSHTAQPQTHQAAPLDAAPAAAASPTSVRAAAIGASSGVSAAAGYSGVGAASGKEAVRNDVYGQSNAASDATAAQPPPKGLPGLPMRLAGQKK